jgi:hypothetical protein
MMNRKGFGRLSNRGNIMIYDWRDSGKTTKKTSVRISGVHWKGFGRRINSDLFGGTHVKPRKKHQLRNPVSAEIRTTRLSEEFIPHQTVSFFLY